MPTKFDRRNEAVGDRYTPVYGRSFAGSSEDLARLRALAGPGGAAGAYQDATGMQGRMYDAYGAMARGEGPSLGQNVLQQGSQRANAAAAALAGQTRGGNIAAAEQAAMQAQFAGQAQASADAAAIAAQEQQAAMAAQAGIAGQLAGQSLEQQMGLEGLVSSGTQAELDAQVQSQLGNRELAQKAKMDRHNRIQNWMKTGSNVVGSILGAIFSDERVKTGVQPSGGGATALVRGAQPIRSSYRPGFGAPGERFGITAQSLERTPEGAALVGTDPATGAKMVDTAQLSAVNTAALAELVPRIDALEQMQQVGRDRAQRREGQANTAEALAARTPSAGGGVWDYPLGQRGVQQSPRDRVSLADKVAALRERNRAMRDTSGGQAAGALAGLFGAIGGA